MLTPKNRRTSSSGSSSSEKAGVSANVRPNICSDDDRSTGRHIYETISVLGHASSLLVLFALFKERAKYCCYLCCKWNSFLVFVSSGWLFHQRRSAGTDLLCPKGKLSKSKFTVSVSWRERCAVEVRRSRALRLKQNLPEKFVETFDGWFFECVKQHQKFLWRCPLLDARPQNCVDLAAPDYLVTGW